MGDSDSARVQVQAAVHARLFGLVAAQSREQRSSVAQHNTEVGTAELPD